MLEFPWQNASLTSRITRDNTQTQELRQSRGRSGGVLDTSHGLDGDGRELGSKKNGITGRPGPSVEVEGRMPLPTPMGAQDGPTGPRHDHALAFALQRVESPLQSHHGPPPASGSLFRMLLP